MLLNTMIPQLAGVLGDRVAARQREGTRNSLQPLQLAGQGEVACAATRELLILSANTHIRTEIPQLRLGGIVHAGCPSNIPWDFQLMLILSIT